MLPLFGLLRSFATALGCCIGVMMAGSIARASVHACCAAVMSRVRMYVCVCSCFCVGLPVFVRVCACVCVRVFVSMYALLRCVPCERSLSRAISTLPSVHSQQFHGEKVRNRCVRSDLLVLLYKLLAAELSKKGRFSPKKRMTELSLNFPDFRFWGLTSRENPSLDSSDYSLLTVYRCAPVPASVVRIAWAGTSSIFALIDGYRSDGTFHIENPNFIVKTRVSLCYVPAICDTCNK